MSDKKPVVVRALEVAPREKISTYPEPFNSRMAKRRKRVLGDLFGLGNFGVNLTTLEPGGESALLHKHTKQDEFIYVVSGTPTLVTEGGEVTLRPGECVGFPANGDAHQLVNRTYGEVTFLEVGDRRPGDAGVYPVDDIKAEMGEDGWVFLHKDGSAYSE